MQAVDKTALREATLFRKLARSLFTARTQTEVADALLAMVSQVTPSGGAVYLETERGFRRVAATGSGLTLPAETDQLKRAALSVHRYGTCALVHDRLDTRNEQLLADAASLAGAALDEVAAKAALRARSRSMADQVAVADERATVLAQTVESALFDAVREVLDAASIEIVESDDCPSGTLCVPLRLDGSTIGVLRVTARASGQFGAAQRRMLDRVAPKLAIAVALARRIEHS
jgi:hypothetical protein